MKIIFDNIIYALQKSGGGSVYWTELIKRFNNLTDHEVSFYDQKEPCQNIFRENLALKNLKTEGFLSLAIRRYLNFTPRIKQKSIFHSSYFRVSGSKKAINVTTVHDLTTEKFRSGLARWVNLQQKKHAVKHAKGIICISENTKKDLLHFIPETNPDKIKVIYNGVSHDFYYIDTPFDIAQQYPKFAQLSNKKYLLYVGHRTNYKNFPMAVMACAAYKNDYQLVVVGEALTAAEKNLLDHHLPNAYVHLSAINNQGLNQLYNQAFALLYPSAYEGFGIPVLEAMKTHCPVIANHSSSIPEVAGDAAILIEDINHHKIAHAIGLLQDSAYRNTLVHKGVQQSALFCWDKTFEAYLSFYKELYDNTND